MKNTLELLKLYYFACKFKKIKRTNEVVENEYTNAWNNWHQPLDKAATLEDFKRINETGKKGLYIKNDKLMYGFCDDSFYIKTIFSILKKEFSSAKKILEFGSGPGRNLLFLKKKNPKLNLMGFELTKSGVELTKKASKKFKLKIGVRRQNILEMKTRLKGDVGFSCFALEQINIPLDDAKKLIIKLLGCVKSGLILLEPLEEYYPKSLRGYFARKFHQKIGYCNTFARACEELALEGNIIIRIIQLTSCHNPLLFPTILIIKKSKRTIK